MSLVHDIQESNRRSSWLRDNTIVSLVVGKEKQVFKVQKVLLCSSSPFFRAALEGNFKEAAEQKIEFPEEQEDVVERFVLWLYSSSVLEKGETPCSLSLHFMIRFYVFAEARLITTLQNEASDLLGRHHDIPPVAYAYSLTSSSSPLRRLVIDMTIRQGFRCLKDPGHYYSLELYPKQALIDLAKAQSQHISGPKEKDFWRTRCEYHNHAEGEPGCDKYAPLPAAGACSGPYHH